MLEHYWALTYCPKLSYKDKYRIISSRPLFEAYLTQDPTLLSESLDWPDKQTDKLFHLTKECHDTLAIDDWFDLIKKGECRYISLYDADYPNTLKEINDPPLGFWLKGCASALTKPNIAVVGSRKATPYGISQCQRFCQAFIEEGLAITSGLAYGIDTCAHRCSIDSSATTIGVLGCGIQRVYPAKNKMLAEKIIEFGGAILSEYHPYDTPLHWHFPERNRLISALSLLVLVIEAAAKSGSLITAGHAANQGRDVFAVPGALTNDSSNGCHQLIKEGAHLADSPKEILAFLGLSPLDRPNKRPNLHHPLIDLLQAGPLHIDKIVQFSGLTLVEVSSMLSALELEGHILRYENGLYYLH